MFKFLSQWRDRRLRKKIVSMFMRNHKFDPTIFNFDDFDAYVQYIKHGYHKV